MLLTVDLSVMHVHRIHDRRCAFQAAYTQGDSHPSSLLSESVSREAHLRKEERQMSRCQLHVISAQTTGNMPVTSNFEKKKGTIREGVTAFLLLCSLLSPLAGESDWLRRALKKKNAMQERQLCFAVEVVFLSFLIWMVCRGEDGERNTWPPRHLPRAKNQTCFFF